MAHPSSALTTLRPVIAGSMKAWDLAAAMAGFIATRVLPVFEVGKASGTFGIIPLKQLLESPDTKRSPGSGYARGRFKFQPTTFATVENGYEEVVDDNESRLYSDYFDAELIAAERARSIVMRNQEIRAAAAVFNTTTWTGAALTTAVSTPWSTHATAVPINDIMNAAGKVWEGSGLWPNALIIDRIAFRHLIRCTQIIDRIAAAGAGDRVRPADITTQQLAQCFDLEEVIVASTPKDSANEGQAVTVASTWDKTRAMVARIAKTGDIAEPCIGRTFHWGEDGSQIGGLVESYREEAVRGEVIRVRHQTDERIYYKEAGHLLTSVTA